MDAAQYIQHTQVCMAVTHDAVFPLCYLAVRKVHPEALEV